MLLKLFEPRSVSVYFSERLQGLYRQYLGGLFDPHLDPAERSVGSAPMTPLRFEDWCLNTYPAIRGRDINAIMSGERTQFFANSASELSAITTAASAEESALSELSTLESQRQQGEAELAAVRLRHMAEVNRALDARWADVPEEKPGLVAAEDDLPKRIM